MQLTVPDPSVVVLVGPSGSGKSTFAKVHFRSTEVVSSDALRGMLADDEDDQAASAEAFHVLALLLNGRLRRRLLTVVDATNLRAHSRRRWLRLAARYDLPAVAVVFDLQEQDFQAHNVRRPDRQVEPEIVSHQAELLRAARAQIPDEGFSECYVLRQPADVREATLERVRPT